MADTAAMSIVIGANVQGAISGLEHLSTELDQLAKGGVTSIGQLDRAMSTLRAAILKATTTGEIEKLNRALHGLEAEAARLRNLGLSQSLSQIGTTAAKTGKDFTGLSRVLQDLPFGFMGIQNNITQLLPAAGGLGLAVSAITAAITFAQIGFSNWTRGMGETKEATDKTAESLRGLSEDAAKNIIEFKGLISVAENTNQSMNIRLAAVEKLRSQYPGYLQNLSDEAILTGKVGSAYEDVNKALLNKIVLELQAEKIKPLLAEQLELTIELQKANRDLHLARLEGMPEFINKSKSITKIIVDDNKVLTKQQELKLKVDGLQAKVNKRQEEYNALLQGVAGLVIPTPDPEKIKKAKDNFMELVEEARKYRLLQESTTGAKISPLFDMMQGKINLSEPTKKAKDFFKAWKEGQDKIKEGRGILPESFFEETDDRTERDRQQRIEDANEKLKEQMLIARELQGVFTGLFTDIAEQGRISFESLTKYIEQLIIKLAAAAATAAVLKFIFAPQTAAGTPLKFMDIFKGMLGFANGGIITGPTIGMIGEAGPEVVLPLDRLREFLPAAGSQVVVMETQIRGDDLYLIQSRTAARRGRAY